MDNDWRNSWESFTFAVCDLYSAGKTDEEVTDHFADAVVRWTGKVIYASVHLTPYYVQLSMPKVKIQIADGRRCVNDYLSLGIAKDDVIPWRDVKQSDRVEFTTLIERRIGIPINQPGLRWDESDAEKRSGYIKISTYGSRFVQMISAAPVRKKMS